MEDIDYYRETGRRREVFVQPYTDDLDIRYGCPEPWDDRQYSYLQVHPPSRAHSVIWAPVTEDAARRAPARFRSRSPHRERPTATVTLQSMLTEQATVRSLYREQPTATVSLQSISTEQAIVREKAKVRTPQQLECQTTQTLQSIPTQTKPAPYVTQNLPSSASKATVPSVPTCPSASMLTVPSTSTLTVQATTPTVTTPQVPVTKEIQTDPVPSSEHDIDSDGENPLPDNNKVSEDLPISPSEDVTKYADLIKKVAMALGFSNLDQHQQVSDVGGGVVFYLQGPLRFF